jgi:hypothetical protein
MTPSHLPARAAELEQRYAAMLDEAGLPRFDRAEHDLDCPELRLCWAHGFTLHIDLERDDYDEIEPFDDEERRAILDLPLFEDADFPEIHVTVPGSPDDPRNEAEIPGLVRHFTPPLHPDDVTVHQGIPVTTPSRTLIDLAEVLTQDELREAFAQARELGLLDPKALRASRARVEWRPSLAMLDEVITEFCA